MNVDTEKGDGFVVISNLKEARLYEKHFEIKEQMWVTIDAGAAFEDDRASSDLAAYPWIVNRSTNQVVWTPRPEAWERDVVKVAINDSLLVIPGEYTVYFTTFGPTRRSRNGGAFLGLKPYWTNDTSFWHINLASQRPDAIAIIDSRPRQASIANVVWSFDTDSRSSGDKEMIRVTERMSMSIDGTLAVCNSGCDDLRLYRIPSVVPVWTLEEATTAAAGGSVVNKTVQATVDLPRGLYRVEFETGYEQNPSSWRANPPYLPYSWGVRLTASSENAAYTFDPWSGAEPIVAILQVGDNADQRYELEIDQEVDVLIYGMGEMSSGDSRYDYGWIERADTGSRVWEMTYEESRYAGGSDMNREQMSILTLPAGRYNVRFVSDGSHSFDSWNKSSPEFEERWGLALFAADPSAVPEGSIRAQAVQTPERDAVDESPVVDQTDDNALVSHIRMGNSEQFDETFSLESDTSIRVRALGELTSNDRYDFGWIERVDTGERIWTMTFENTEAAGGDSRNRLFNGLLQLSSGQYAVHFETDPSHAWGSFDDNEPRNSEQWGIAIFLAE